MQITSDLILKATGYSLPNNINFEVLGLAVTNSGSRILTFIESQKYISTLNSNQAIGGVFCTQEIADTAEIRTDIQLIVVDDPKWIFFSLVDYFGKNRQREKTIIDTSSNIHETAFISPVGVKIGKNCLIEPRATILSDVILGDNVVVRAGAVIGSEGFEHKTTSKGILSVTHDGVVDVKDNVEIGANSFVSKGFSYRPTIIGKFTKLDAFIHYAHGVQSGENCLIVAHAMIGGNVTIGNNVWIGPSSAISNRLILEDGCFITLGSVVTRNIKAGEKVSGNFAIPHALFLRNLKEIVK